MVNIDVFHVEQKRDLVEAIGKVTVRWASFDHMLTEIVGIVLDNRAAAVDLILTRPGAGRQRVEAFERAIGGSKLEQWERADLLELSGRASQLLAKRNDIVHSPLVTSIELEGTKFSYVIQKMTRKGERKDFDPGDINRHLEDVSLLLVDLENQFLLLAGRYVELPDDVEPPEDWPSIRDR
jgi:hypothetical protein